MLKKLLPQNKSETGLFIILVLFMLGLGAKISYLLDLINHFRPYLLLVFLCLIIYQALKKYQSKIWIYLVLALLLNLNTFPHLPSRLSSPELSNSTIKIMHLNLLAGNNNYQKTLNLIKTHNPHLISFQEATLAWEKKIQEELTEYNFVCKPIDSPFGICVAINIPIIEQSIFYLSDSHIPAIYIKSQVNNQYLSLVFVHPPPPFNSFFFEQRNAYYEKLINKIQGDENLILVGDLNITQWSPIYQELESKLSLRNTLSGFEHTWPSFFPVPIFQLDHILISQNLGLIKAQVLENIGSDHFPLISEIAIFN
jgi:endonuclease/exonuclease/phosphatase (EEP) superfamily protein YafD